MLEALIIGFSGHTQSLGHDGDEGPIWNIYPNSGAYQLGTRIKSEYGAFAVTMFPEDPGNHSFVRVTGCGDGVFGRGNSHDGGLRIDAAGGRTGALAFLVDAIKNRGVRNVGLFGYSHGGGSVRLLMDALAYEASRDSDLLNKLIDLPLHVGVNFFWSSYIDAVHIAPDDVDNVNEDPTGTPFPELEFPAVQIPDVVGSASSFIGSKYHFGAYQRSVLPMFRDSVPVAGQEIDPNLWTAAGRDAAYLFQVLADTPSLDWSPHGLDHTDRKGWGIAEDDEVQQRVLDSLAVALATWPPI